MKEKNLKRRFSDSYITEYRQLRTEVAHLNLSIARQQQEIIELKKKFNYLAAEYKKRFNIF